MSGTVISSPAGFFQGTAVSAAQIGDLEAAIENANANAAAAAASAAAAAASASSAAAADADANSVITNIANDVTTSTANASTASTAATSATASATAADASATAAATSATNAATSETNAATSATNATTGATNASASATQAANSATDAANSATAAASSATAASNSATAANTSSTQASGYASAAATSASTASSAAATAVAAAILPNQFVNGDLRINQRNFGVNATPGNQTGVSAQPDFGNGCVAVADCWSVQWRACATNINPYTLTDADITAIGTDGLRTAVSVDVTGSDPSNASAVVAQSCPYPQRFVGQSVTMSAWVKVDTAGNKVGASVLLRPKGQADSASVVRQQLGTPVAIATANTWTRVTFTGTVPADSLANFTADNAPAPNAPIAQFCFGLSDVSYGSTGTGSQNGTFWMTAMELVFGGSANPAFHIPDPELELIRARHFLQAYPTFGMTPNYTSGGQTALAYIPLGEPMYANPTLVVQQVYQQYNVSSAGIASIGGLAYDRFGVLFQALATAAGPGTYIAYVLFSAELF